MKTVLTLLCFLGLGWCLWSCQKSSSNSDILEISFKKLVVEDRMVLDSLCKMADLTFHFEDGDGDLGSPDPENPLSQIFVTWEKKLTDGTYETYTSPDWSSTQKYTIPYDDRMNRDEAQNKTLKGTIKVELFAPRGSLGDMDTVRIEFYITDRSLHSSNTDYTPDFSILDDNVLIE